MRPDIARRELEALYKRYAPAKVDDPRFLDGLLSKYTGRYDQLLKLVRSQYEAAECTRGCGNKCICRQQGAAASPQGTPTRRSDSFGRRRRVGSPPRRKVSAAAPPTSPTAATATATPSATAEDAAADDEREEEEAAASGLAAVLRWAGR